MVPSSKPVLFHKLLYRIEYVHPSGFFWHLFFIISPSKIHSSHHCELYHSYSNLLYFLPLWYDDISIPLFLPPSRRNHTLLFCYYATPFICLTLLPITMSHVTLFHLSYLSPWWMFTIYCHTGIIVKTWETTCAPPSFNFSRHISKSKLLITLTVRR